MCTGLIDAACFDCQNSSHQALVAASVPGGGGGYSAGGAASTRWNSWRRCGRVSTRVPGGLRLAGIRPTGPSGSCRTGTTRSGHGGSRRRGGRARRSGRRRGARAGATPGTSRRGRHATRRPPGRPPYGRRSGPTSAGGGRCRTSTPRWCRWRSRGSRHRGSGDGARGTPRAKKTGRAKNGHRNCRGGTEAAGSRAVSRGRQRFGPPLPRDAQRAPAGRRSARQLARWSACSRLCSLGVRGSRWEGRTQPRLPQWW